MAAPQCPEHDRDPERDLIVWMGETAIVVITDTNWNPYDIHYWCIKIGAYAVHGYILYYRLSVNGEISLYDWRELLQLLQIEGLARPRWGGP